MPYTSLGTLIAATVFIIGCVQVALAFGIMMNLVVEPSPGLFLGSATPSAAIDSGILKILASVAFGMLTEISRSVSK